MNFENYKEELQGILNTLEYTKLPEDLDYSEHKEAIDILHQIILLAINKFNELGGISKSEDLFEMMANILNPEVKNAIQS